METRDQNGLTEKEFLKLYDQNKWPHPSFTADCVILTKEKVLMVRRANHPCIGRLAFPGGFVNEDEAAEDAAVRELKEETGADAPPLFQLVTMSTPGRDPRCWIVTAEFCSFVKEPFPVKGGDDAAAAEWYDYEIEYSGNSASIKLSKDGNEEYSEVHIVRDAYGRIDGNKSTSSGAIAFDHAKVLLMAYEKMNKGDETKWQ